MEDGFLLAEKGGGGRRTGLGGFCSREKDWFEWKRIGRHWFFFCYFAIWPISVISQNDKKNTKTHFEDLFH